MSSQDEYDEIVAKLEAAPGCRRVTAVTSTTTVGFYTSVPAHLRVLAARPGRALELDRADGDWIKRRRIEPLPPGLAGRACAGRLGAARRTVSVPQAVEGEDARPPFDVVLT
jgi:hypothetical protein